MNDFVELAPDATLMTSGYLKYIKWNTEKYPHMCIFGSTGSGKTFFLKIILGRISRHVADAELIICDFKSDEDFSFLEGSLNFYRFDQCLIGLERVVSLLKERQFHNTDDRHPVFLVFDEWASFINSLDKKVAEKAKQDLTLLLMLGRSFHIHVIISQQRMDSSYFNSARDNFSVIIGMGKLSKESVEMMFSEYKNIIDRNKDRGCGSVIIGSELKEIIVPAVRDMNILHGAISLSCNPCPKDENR